MNEKSRWEVNRNRDIALERFEDITGAARCGECFGERGDLVNSGDDDLG